MADTGARRSWGYEIAYVIVVVLLVFVAIVTTRRSRVGVVDTRHVTRDLGVDDLLAKEDQRWSSEMAVKVDEVRERTRRESESLEAQIARASEGVEKTRLREALGRVRQEQQTAILRMTQDYQRRREEVRRGVRARLDPVLKDVARARRLDVVLDSAASAAVLYAHKRVDVTADVLAAGRGIPLRELVSVEGPAPATNAAAIRPPAP